MPHGQQAPAPSAEGPTQHTQNQDDTPRLLNQNTHGYTREEQIEALRKLREPFDPSEIRYLPRVWCGACRDARGKVCDRADHARRQCNKCGQKMTSAHIDLRFVGHAEATNRLLNVDPFWDWEPLARDAAGLPQYDGNRGLWIRLTVCGMSRLGYGHADSKSGGDAVKEIIGDAIRNAGMRFGMALNLWTSSDLLIVENGGDGGERESERPRPAEVPPAKEGPQRDPVEEALLAKLMKQTQDHWTRRDVLTQVRGEAEAKGLLARSVQGPDGKWMPFSLLLDNRITELEAAQGGESRRAA